MKTIRLWFAVLLIASMAQAAEKFEIISYFPDKGTVWVNQGAGQTNRPFSSFSVAEQQKINGWLAAKTFKNDSALLVDIRQEKRSEDIDKIDSGDSRTDGKKRTTKYFHRTGTQDVIAYTITLKNLSEIVLSDITVEYQLFYEADDGGDKTKKKERARVQIAELRPECAQTNRTTEIALRDEQVETYENSFVRRDIGSKEVKGFRHIYNKDQLKGLYVCVSTLDENGDLIKREHKIGRVPGEEEWDHYEGSNTILTDSNQQAHPQKQTSSAPKKASPDQVLTDEQIEAHKRAAEGGSRSSAYGLCRHYSRQGDVAQTKRWADRVRKLVAKLPPDQRAALSGRYLASLEQLEKEAEER
ncbi:MAG: hypothetical protein HOO88_04155 [Kiritimatiellaceae bacterium]|nr:hypothetical protein [Kiritimatiellaceae bacterium]